MRASWPWLLALLTSCSGGASAADAVVAVVDAGGDAGAVDARAEDGALPDGSALDAAVADAARPDAAPPAPGRLRVAYVPSDPAWPETARACHRVVGVAGWTRSYGDDVIARGEVARWLEVPPARYDLRLVAGTADCELGAVLSGTTNFEVVSGWWFGFEDVHGAGSVLSRVRPTSPAMIAATVGDGLQIADALGSASPAPARSVVFDDGVTVRPLDPSARTTVPEAVVGTIRLRFDPVDAGAPLDVPYTSGPGALTTIFLVGTVAAPRAIVCDDRGAGDGRLAACASVP